MYVSENKIQHNQPVKEEQVFEVFSHHLWLCETQYEKKLLDTLVKDKAKTYVNL